MSNGTIPPNEPPFVTFFLEHLDYREREAINDLLLPPQGPKAGKEAPLKNLLQERNLAVLRERLEALTRQPLTTEQSAIILKAIDYFSAESPPDHALHELEAGRAPATNTPSVPNVIGTFLQTMPTEIQDQLIAIFGKAKLPRGVERVPFTYLCNMTDAHAVADYLERVWETGLNRAEMDLLQDLKDFVNLYLASPPVVAGAINPSGQEEPRPLHPLEFPIGPKQFTVPFGGVLWHWVLQDHEALAAHFRAYGDDVRAAAHLLAAANKRFKTHDFKMAANLALQAYLLVATYQDAPPPASYEDGDNLLMIEAALLECQACLRTLQYERAHVVLSEVNTRIREYKAAHNSTEKPFHDIIFERTQKLANALQDSLDEILASVKLDADYYAAVFNFLYAQDSLSHPTRRAAHARALTWRSRSADEPEKRLVKITGSVDPEGMLSFAHNIQLYADGPEDVERWLPDAVRADLYDLLYHVQLGGGDANAAYDTLLKKIGALLKTHQTVAAMGAGEATLKLAVDYADSAAGGKSPDFYQLVEVYQQALADPTLDASYKDNLVVFIAALSDQWFDHLKEKGLNPIAVLVEQVEFLVAQDKIAIAKDVLRVKIAMQDSYINIDPTEATGMATAIANIMDLIESVYCPTRFLVRNKVTAQFFVAHPAFLKGVLQCLALIYKNEMRNQISGDYYEKLAASWTDVEVPARNIASNWHEEIKTGGVFMVNGQEYTLARVEHAPDEAPVAISLLMTKGQRFLQNEKFQDAAIVFNQAYYLATQWDADPMDIASAAGAEALAWLSAKFFEPALVATLDALSRTSTDSVDRVNIQNLKAKLRSTAAWLPKNLDIYNLLVSVLDATEADVRPSHRATIACCVLANTVLVKNALQELLQKLGEIRRNPQWLLSKLRSYAPLAQSLSIDSKYKKAFTKLSDLLTETRENPEPEPSGPSGGRRLEPLTLRVVSNQPAASREKQPAGKRGEPDGGAAAILAGRRVVTGRSPLITAAPLMRGATILQAPEVIATTTDSTPRVAATPAPPQPDDNLAPVEDTMTPPLGDAAFPLNPGILHPAAGSLHRGASLRLVTTRR